MNAKQTHQHAVLVCIYENNLERRSLPYKHRVDGKATVVRSYKGTWQIGETINFSRDLESVPQDWKPSVGFLAFLFLDTHSANSTPIDVGEEWLYKPEFERALLK